VIVVIVGIIWSLKKKKNQYAEDKVAKSIQAQKDIKGVLKEIKELVAACDDRKTEIQEVRKDAEAQVQKDGANGIFSMDDIKAISGVADDLKTNPGYTSLKAMVAILEQVGDDLQKMQGRMKVETRKNCSPIQDAATYLDEESRKAYFDAIENDKTVLKAFENELITALSTLKTIAYHTDVPFSHDIFITVDDGHRQYKGGNMKADAFGVTNPGVFQLDKINFLGDGIWQTFSKIMKKPTGIRILSIDAEHIRVAAPQPIFTVSGRKVRILDFTYDKKAEIIIDGVTITLAFK
jgi:hypothetical protein